MFPSRAPCLSRRCRARHRVHTPANPPILAVGASHLVPEPLSPSLARFGSVKFRRELAGFARSCALSIYIDSGHLSGWSDEFTTTTTSAITQTPPPAGALTQTPNPNIPYGDRGRKVGCACCANKVYAAAHGDLQPLAPRGRQILH